ncbi:MAG: hypothetical protein COU71_02410 [Parcubacteria group bacterium CG10_big_fil_rev_8_21_14_0_10_38_31]|nr:MAG: hypothetical protein COU71_02410 [Parcubacteria group bacterium CG10_big_fil_rev_8_21_14_0_10_38_31]
MATKTTAKLKTTKKIGKKTFVVASPEICFWVNSGPIVRSLPDLVEALKTMSDEQYSYHVNDDKNDFSRWIEDVLGDKTLAKALMKYKTRTGTLKAVSARLKDFYKI